MAPTRVIVVDDSSVIRKIVSAVLAEDPDIEVCGVAANGKIALDKIRSLDPDVVTLDIEMPVMDGLEVVQELRKTHTQLAVIMFSTLTERGASATIEALARGATDYVTKPNAGKGLEEARERIRRELVPKVRVLGRLAKRTGSRETRPAVVPPRPRMVRTAPAGPPKVVAIGVSTGGPNALARVVPELPADLGVPVLIVQHMPPMFTRMLAERLNAQGALEIEEGYEGALVGPGQVWIAPGGMHMRVVKDGAQVKLALNEDPPENSCRPAVDVLFRSVAELYGGGTLAVVMTGMGHDGREGARQICEQGGRILAQDEESSVVWGMPGAVVEAGIASEVLPLESMAGTIVSQVRGSHARAALRGRDS